MGLKSSMALAAHVAASTRRLRRRYRKELARCQKRFSGKSVHQLRVETRRMLALVDLLRALRAGASLKKIRKLYKQRLDLFDQLRDTHVQLLLLKPLWPEFPEARPFDSWLRRQQKRLTPGLRRSIRATKQVRVEQRLKEIEKQLRKSARADGSPPGKAQARAALAGAFARVVTLRQRVHSRHPETIHRMRVAFKRFRYMSELLQPVFPPLTTKRLRQMQAYQGLMGDIQDLEVLLTGLGQVVAEGHLPAGQARGLRRELMRRRRELVHTFVAAADKLYAFAP
jgi:CHAD domain-containing protein